MRLDPNNDAYPGDLGLLNARKHLWAKGETRAARYKIGSYVILAAGFAAILAVALKVKEGNQLPLHITIWTVALLSYLAARKGKQMSEAPFNGYHSARFEVSDDTVYYIYQQGMKLKTYFIQDADIRKISRDDEWGILYIEGQATLNTQSRKDETRESLNEFYALVPFDKYELDDLLAPYRSKVVKANGKLRQQYSDNH